MNNIKFLQILLLALIHSLVFCEHFIEEILHPKENFVEIPSSRKLSHFRNEKWRLNPAKNVVLYNLNEIVDKLPSCLNHIINYNQIDLLPFQTPIVLSRYDIVHVKYKSLKGWLTSKPVGIFPEWDRIYPFEKASKILANASKEISWCRRESLRDDSECVDIPFVDNSPKAKGWWCESHWYLFPPNPVEDPLFYEGDGTPSTPIRMVIPGSYKKF